jgi:hypothetical protein
MSEKNLSKTADRPASLPFPLELVRHSCSKPDTSNLLKSYLTPSFILSLRLCKGYP